MRRKIYKYALTPDNSPDDTTCTVATRKGAEVLTIQARGSTIWMWASVDPEAEVEMRTFKVVGTWWDYNPEGLKYIATVHDSWLVWHIFELL